MAELCPVNRKVAGLPVGWAGVEGSVGIHLEATSDVSLSALPSSLPKINTNIFSGGKCFLKDPERG